MSHDSLRLADHVGHDIQAIKRIEIYIKSLDESSFNEDMLVQDGVIRNVEVIGEACNNIRKQFPEFAALHPDVPFQAAYEMRNALAHGYHKIDLRIL